MPEDVDTVHRSALEALARPGLVVLTGPPGIGRSTALTRVAAAFAGPVFTGGGLAMLRTVPGFALSHALRVRLPTHDLALLAEAVRSRVHGGLLVLDDLHWADPATLAALPAIAEHCRVLVALRTPHAADTSALRRPEGAAATWLTVPPLADEPAAALVRQVAPALPAAAVAAVLRRAGGSPLALRSLAQQAGSRITRNKIDVVESDSSSDMAPADVREGVPVIGTTMLAHAVATALAELTRPARTAMAALGLLGRPADPPCSAPGSPS